ncbi:uncharacterized protein LOC135954228 [Calliphora vicina]|uniref:uncharacterized protein LOC135954228 n=1 Tax=Calliphora vicina TaxID=7373 RepID=UPI00325AB414
MDPGRHHDFLANTDDRSNRNNYYGREIPEITSHHYYGPATTTTRTVSSNTRKPCGCTTTGSGATAGSITCNGCHLNPADEGGGWPTMATNNPNDHSQRGAVMGGGGGGVVGVGGAVVGMGMTGDYHQRMAPEAAVRSNIRQSPLYVQQHPHQQHVQQQIQQQPMHGPSMIQAQHPGHVGNMPGSRTSYWPQSGTPASSTSSSGTQPYGGAGDEQLGVLTNQSQLDISVTRRNAPAPNDYGPYKSMSMPTNATHAGQHNINNSGSSNSAVSGYQLPTSSLNTSNPLHQRVSAIGGPGGGGANAAAGSTNANTPYMSKDQRIYEHQKYSTPSSASTAKMVYNNTPTTAMYDSHHHHHLNNQAMGKTLPIDHHVINPSNLPTSKEQHPSPNYARKCPQMYAPEEQTTAHQHLYMSTPQFSSDKFTRASPQQQQQQQPPPPPPPSDYTKLRESPSGSSYMVAPHSDKYTTPHSMQHASHLRESPQFPTHTTTATTSMPRNPSSYYPASQSQNPSKILPPEMSPIIMKQSHHTHHYQYSKSPLPPPLPPSHLQQQTIPPPNTQMAAKSQTSMNVGPPPPPSNASVHSQRYLMDSVKREDLEMYENPNQTSSRHNVSGIYINPYNTPPPTGDNCCKEVALSASSSPYTTGSATPNYRVESPQFYPTKYAKLAMNENLTNSSKHSLINQNTPPPSRAPSQRGQHQANYYYEGNSHSAPSPAAATAASPSPSALLTTTSQTPMHHTEYMSSTLQPGPTIGPPPPSQLVGANMPQSYATQPPMAAQQQHHLAHHQHQPTSAALRNNDLMITVQPTSTHPYERAIHHPNQPTSSQHLNSKHVLTHPTSTTSSGLHSAIQMPQGSASAGKPVAKHQKPNYRELINQKLAMRNATSEEELNMQIIKKTLNVDSQNIRAPANTSNQQHPLTGSNRGIAAMPNPQLQATERLQSASSVRESANSLKQHKPSGSVLVTHSTLPSTARIIEGTEALPPQRLCIKQEDEKPSSSSSSTTASSPLDLSMRTVKTKADSTDYKYQQRPRLTNPTASSTTSSEGRYTLPRVDSTPIFSVHAFEPGAAAAASMPVANRQPTSRHNSLDRRNYTPPTSQQATHKTTMGGGSPYPPSSTQHIPAASSTHHPYGNSGVGSGSGSTRRTDLSNNVAPQSPHPMSCYENSLVIKTAPKLNNLNSDLVVRPSTITAPPATPSNAQTCRPSVLETNPYATVIKSETKRFNQTPPASPHHTLAAVERLPPDTSIMALPARNPYGVVRSAIQTNHNANANISSSNPITPSNYSLACEKNPNFLGRKRHLQEYSQQMSLNEPDAKHKRYMDSLMPATAKPQIPMRPADISVIAVNELKQEEVERRSLIATKSRTEEEVSSVIASTMNCNSSTNNSKVIVNNINVNVTNHTASPSVLVVCKQEPLTPTGDPPNPACAKTPEMPVNAFTARIRTKAELKGFTFNPPPPPPIQMPEINHKPASPAKVVTIKQEEVEEDLLLPVDKIKEEVVSKIELPSIPGLDDEFEEKNLLDFGWSNTCNNFMEQLLTRPSPKKKCNTNIPLNKACKDADMVVTSSEAVTTTTTMKLPQENHNFSTMESADNTTRSSFARLDAGVESSITFNNVNQDSLNSQCSGFIHKKMSKTDREKKRYQQEKRLAERLKAKQSSSESEDELDKRKTERLKKPLMKTKNKLKSAKTGSNTNSNSSSSTTPTDKNRFSDCGSDSTSTGMTEEKSNAIQKSPIKIEIKQEILDKEEHVEKLKNNEQEKCDIKLKDEDKKDKMEDKTKKKSCNISSKAAKEEKQTIKKEPSNNKAEERNKTKQEEKSSTEASEHENEEEDEEEEEEEDDEEEEEDEEVDANKTKVNTNPKGKITKQALNTMTRSKRKQELEQQLANSKVLRNDKVIRNFANSNSSNKIKRKYTRKYNTVNSLLESGGLSRESGIMKSTRLRAKLERNGGKLNLVKNNKTKSNNKLQNNNIKDSAGNKMKNSKPENVHERNVIDLYRFKRALKVPPSLINIKHPGAHKIAASLPDLERHAEALEAYAKKREKNSQKNQTKVKSSKNYSGSKLKPEAGNTSGHRMAVSEEPKSIIDLLHSRVTKASGINVRNKTTTTTAVYRPTKPCCTTSSNNVKPPLSNSNNNCGMFSETSQTTESSELQMLPELKKDSDIEEDNDDNDSTNGKKRHFSIFDTKVLPTKTRTESKLQQKKENIREIFVGDDRPASAPPEITQTLDATEKMTYEQKYEQFLQQMNIVVSADTLGRLGRTAAAKKLPGLPTANSQQDLSALNIKQEEFDTESTSVIDADELKDDHKLLPNLCRKRRGKYLRRKGSSGFDYIRKKKKPTPASSSAHNHASQHNHHHNGPLSNLHNFSIKSEKYDMDEYKHKIKTEDDVSREIQKWVLNKGVGQSTMHKAARQGYMDVIVYCLDRMGMNPDQKDNAGYTPLHEACTNGWLNIARVLLQYGANHSEAAHSGIRPLHEASENDHEEIVRLLLSYGADPLLATYSGQTPLMLASSKTMRDILSNHLVDVQSMGPERKPWRFNGPWEIYDPSECGYNMFEGAPNTVCDMSRALLRRGSLTNNQMYQNNKKLFNVLNTTNATATTTQQTLTNNLSLTAANTATASTGQSAMLNNSNNNNNNNNNNAASSSSTTSANSSSSSSNTLQAGIEVQQLQQQHQQLKTKGETSTKTVMEKCAVVLDNIDHFNAVRLNNANKPEILVENSDSDGEMFEFEEADVLLPPLYLLKDEGTQDKWVLLNDLCNLLKVKSKDTLLNKIYPSTSSTTAASLAIAHKSLMRELKMSDFLEKATCLQLLCAGEKINICASKVVLIKYNENVRNLLGVKTILMKF